MRAKKGSKRWALIVGPLVFKVPRIRFSVLRTQDALRSISKGEFKSALRNLNWARGWFWSAIMQNWSEYQSWRELRTSYLAPVYLSIGLLNVSKFIEGDKPSFEELDEVWGRLGREAYYHLRCLDPHLISGPNIIRRPQGYCFVDYGDNTSAGLRLGKFLKLHHQELVTALASSATSP